MKWILSYLAAAICWGLYTGLRFGAAFYHQHSHMAPVFLILFAAVIANLGVTLYGTFRHGARPGFKAVGLLSLGFAFFPIVSSLLLFAGAFVAEISGIPTNVFVVGLGMGAMYTLLSLPVFGFLATLSFTILLILHYRAKRTLPTTNSRT